MSQTQPARVLLAVTFYNGRAFAARTLESISRLAHPGFELDVLVLDDASPEPGFSEYLSELSQSAGATYYRTPRNLGIPRNVNLGLATAQRLGYDYAVISNSDVIYSKDSVKVLFDVATRATDAASVTAWSTNVDPYSLPNGVELFVESQDVVDRIGDALSAEFGASALRVPAGISFAMMVPVAVLDTVGLMDPVFGRGYGEESDWSARADSAGYSHLLAQGAFVYHAGRGSTLAAGVVSGKEIADWRNQGIVDHRTPMFQWNVDGFLRSGELDHAKRRAVEAIVRHAAAERGYAVINSSRDWEDVDQGVVAVAIRSAEHELCTAHWCGFTADIDTDSVNVLGAVRRYFGDTSPVYTNISPAQWEGAGRYGYPLEL
ncbi:glycosyltransferase family 2 protein [Microbacterium sp. CIAB417]|uniref:glycosyltransferase family 2 protein n=1 Tax=Microbacterium sp. CIAB417 TaxID=2860287 RepID=UPI001FAD1DF9|nr:glycosyltransferase [Microbacterium sp. CIAB417]